jgi:hypothetical protein
MCIRLLNRVVPGPLCADSDPCTLGSSGGPNIGGSNTKEVGGGVDWATAWDRVH